jgi:hypothetical protein
VRFKEIETDFLVDAKLVGEHVLVRSATPGVTGVNIFKIDEFIERFDEAYVQ